MTTFSIFFCNGKEVDFFCGFKQREKKKQKEFIFLFCANFRYLKKNDNLRTLPLVFLVITQCPKC
jgi:hypothetical protein